MSPKQAKSGKKRIFVQIKEIKRLCELVVGEFTIFLDSSVNKDEDISLMKAGKEIGMVKYEVKIVRKEDLLSQQEKFNRNSEDV